MSAKEFLEWQLFNSVEPFGYERMDLVGGIIASTIVNVNRRRGQAARTPDLFMPDFGIKRGSGKKKRQHWTEQLRIVETLNDAFGGRDERNG